MDQAANREMAEYISNELRLKTLPIGAKFLKTAAELPPKARRPSVVLGKRVTICQCVTMARTYGWTVGITRDDVICVAAMIVFGFTPAEDPVGTLSELFCEIAYAGSVEGARREVESVDMLKRDEYEAIALAPLEKGLFEPDSVVIYGNPAQIMRIVQALVYSKQRRIPGNFGGKIECAEYLISPFRTQAPRVSIPGMGDRIFSMTQDDEMVFSFPGALLEDLVKGLRESGKKVGARYPVTFYQNFQPEFPKQHKDLAKSLGLF